MALAVWFVIVAFATYRVALLVTSEEGPFRIMERFRNWFTEPDWIGRGVRCVWCVSFWLALFLSLLVWSEAGLSIWTYPAFSLGVAGLALFIHEQRWKR